MFKNLPQKPGVYWFIDKHKKVIYVGKAKNLKKRLLSYQSLSSSAVKTRTMIARAKQLKFKVLGSELEALLIEAELIKIHQPFYNSLLKDDKSPLYLYFTRQTYPQLKIARKTNLTNIKKNDQFGPFPSKLTINRILKFIRPVFPWCSATKSQIKNKKACFYYHLRLCPGACLQTITPEAYAQNISALKMFLRGKKRTLITGLKKQMITYAKNKDFEHAALIRDQFNALQNLTQPFLKAELNLPCLTEDIQKMKLDSLRRLISSALSLPSRYPLSRIEAYDISNLQGKQATGSMVVFKNSLPDKSQYRRFKINLAKTPDDPKMIFETLSRRLKHPQWPTPGLMVIDGGRTQLKAALKAVNFTLPVVSIAKNPDRLLIPNLTAKTIQTVKLDLKNPAAQLLIALRDESHRFAKNYHLYLRSSKFLS